MLLAAIACMAMGCCKNCNKGENECCADSVACCANDSAKACCGHCCHHDSAACCAAADTVALDSVAE